MLDEIPLLSPNPFENFENNPTITCTLSEHNNNNNKNTDDNDNTLFSFGLVADVQYLDREDGSNFVKTKIRRYRQTLNGLKMAVKLWNHEIKTKNKMLFIGQLGDLIDGFNKDDNKSQDAMDTILGILDKCVVSRFYHCIGNHELYNFTRLELNEMLTTHRCSTVGNCVNR
eukprot:Pgem_evm1s19744